MSTNYVEEVVHSVLRNNNAIFTRVGRYIYCDFFEQQPDSFWANSKCVLIYTILEDNSEETLDGCAGLVHPVVRVICLSKDRTAVRALAEEVRLALQGYHSAAITLWNSPADVPTRTVEVQGVNSIGRATGYDPDLELYEIDRDFEIWLAETIPT